MVPFCGIDSIHGYHDLCIKKEDSPYFLLMFFKTPFSYKTNSNTKRGEKFYYYISSPHTYTEHGSAEVPFSDDWIYFDNPDAKRLIEKFKLPCDSPFYINNHSIIAPYVQKIRNELTFKSSCYKEKVELLVCDMIIDLGRNYEISKLGKENSFEAINEARAYMLNNIDKKITIEELADMANYSKSRFCVLYNEFFGKTPIDELMDLRIEKAKSLLLYSHASVTEAASACGFSSVHYFSRKFKERTGLPPSSFFSKG